MPPAHHAIGNSTNNVGVLVSGGLDSVALIDHYTRKGCHVWPVYVRCGLRWEDIELVYLRKFLNASHHSRLHPLQLTQLRLDNAYQHNWSQTGSIPGYGSSDDAVFLPARNLLLIVKSLLHLSSQGVFKVALATLKGNPFPDATAGYFRKLESLLGLSFKSTVHIETPFRQLSKQEVIARHKAAPLSLSFSCINPKGKIHCGRCNKCAERRRAFKVRGALQESPVCAV